MFNAAPREAVAERVLYSNGDLQPGIGTRSWNDPQPDTGYDAITYEGASVIYKDLFVSGGAGEFMSVYADDRLDVEQFTHVRFTARGIGDEGASIYLSMASEAWAGADMRVQVDLSSDWDTYTVPMDMLVFSNNPGGYAGIAFLGAMSADESLSNEVAFADIRLVELPDIDPPDALKAVGVDATRIRITFSEAIDIASGVSVESYAVLSSDDTAFAEGIQPESVTLLSSGMGVELKLPHTLADNARYAVRVDGVSDVAGNALPETTLAMRVTVREVDLSVNANVDINPFSSNIRGVAMNNWNWLWSDIMDEDSEKRAALIQATKEIRPGIIRFAGGLWVNATGWDRHGVSPDDGYWEYVDSRSDVSYEYFHSYTPRMIDSYADFARQVGARTIIQVNICDNNPAMWADLVRYTNIERSYGFEYWELGNELNLDECIDEREYAERFVTYSNALKSVDPAIKILGPVPSMPYFSSWYDALYENSEVDLDVLAFHWYQLTEWSDDTDAFQYQGGSLEGMFSYNTAVGTFCQEGFGCPGGAINPSRLDRMTYRRAMAEAVSQRIFVEYWNRFPDGETAITEIGVHASDHERPINGNHLGAVWLADILARWAYNGLDILTYYSLEDGTNSVGNSRGLLGSNGADLIDVRPIYYTEWLYAQLFGDTMLESATSDPGQEVVVWASRDSADPRSLKLMLINMSSERARATVRLSGFAPLSGEAYVMSSSDPASMDNPGSFSNHQTTINGVRIPDLVVGDTSDFTQALNSIEPVSVPVGSEFEYELQAYSVVAITLR